MHHPNKSTKPHILLLGIFYLFISFFTFPNQHTSAINSGTLQFYNQSGIHYYNPTGAKCTTTNSTATVSGNTNMDKIWNFFVEANIPGVSDNIAVIAGIMGNLQQESNFNPFIVSNSGYIGLVQWGGGRKSALQSLMSQAGLDSYWRSSNAPADAIEKAIEIELNFAIQEGQFQSFASKLNNVDNTTGEEGAESYSDLFLVIVEGAYNGTSTLIDSYAQSLTSRSTWQQADKRRQYAKAIYQNYLPYATTANGKASGTGNYNEIMKAKNADKQYTDFPPATFSDTDTNSMKILLENYGDLAYQLGRVVGAPWIAILVQMRYEDPNSVCGKNNFWGNGCPPGTPAGGASIQGKNLGEGFQQYGRTLTNGYHDQAIGVMDPSTYLEKIGPTWVQGNVNGAGYGSIEGMKKSVAALENYVNSSEGQATVKNFTNYSPSLGMSANCIPLSGASNIGEAAQIPENERINWLFPNGQPTTEVGIQPYLTTITVPIIDENGNKTTKNITLHQKLASEMEAIFTDLMNAGFRIKVSTTGMYNWRANGTASEHSLGLAIDINWDINPDYKPAPANPSSVYSGNSSDPLKVDDEIVRIFRSHGFYWGGCYSNRVDLMHFGYRDKPNAITKTRYPICTEQ